MKIKDLQTLDEVLHYAALGEVAMTTQEDWDYIEQLLLANSESRYEEGVSAGQEELNDQIIESDYEYECGYEQGFKDGGGE